MLYGFLLKSGYQFRCVYTSVFSPTQMVEFLGIFLDLVAMTDSATMQEVSHYDYRCDVTPG